MNVKLVSMTKPVEDLSVQEFISYVARVSNPSNQMNTETAPKLLAYLIKNKHWSPFEMAHMTVEIVTSRGIAAQILRHRSFSFQEFSQRYAEVTNFETYPARRQDSKNRQNSIDDMSREDKAWFTQSQQVIQDLSQNLYQQALEKQIAKELARFILPLGTQTTLYMSGSVRSWIHYVELRADKATQLEHREIAEACKKILIEVLPDVSKALGWTQ